jgi:hypothetical protein
MQIEQENPHSVAITDYNFRSLANAVKIYEQGLLDNPGLFYSADGVIQYIDKDLEDKGFDMYHGEWIRILSLPLNDGTTRAEFTFHRRENRMQLIDSDHFASNAAPIMELATLLKYIYEAEETAIHE